MLILAIFCIILYIILSYICSNIVNNYYQEPYTVVQDINGETRKIPLKFKYLGYKFIETDTED